MAKKKEQIETASATLPKGTVIHGSKEVVDRVSRNTGTAPRESAKRSTTANK